MSSMFSLDDKIVILECLPPDHRVKMLYMWVKQDAITLKEFKELLKTS